MTFTTLLALDIDGTLTEEHHYIPKMVMEHLHELYNRGAEILFITGRTFVWTYPALKELTFPYSLAVQNGAHLIEMPSRKILRRHLLNSSIIGKMEEICKEEPTDFVIYSGFEEGDICYFRPKGFSPDLLEYALYRAEKIGEKWVAVDTFQEIPIKAFASIKCFGEEASLQRIALRAEKELSLHMPVTFDPIRKSFRIAQGTLQGVDKGSALLDFKSINRDKDYRTIAAGNDFNDLPLFEEADISVAVEGAPEGVKRQVEIVAPIIEGLKEAMRRLDESRDQRP